MKQLRKLNVVLVAVIVSLFMLTGCVSVQNYNAGVQTWRGAKASGLFAVWGYPDRKMKLANGHTLYIYNSHIKGTEPIVTTPGSTTVYQRHGESYVSVMPPMVSGGGSYDLRCRTWFNVNKHGVIVNVSFRGNNCVASKSFIMQRGNPMRPPAP